jgi:Homeodomain-like domain
MAILGSEDVRTMTVLTMSTAEVSRFDTLMRLDRGEIRVADAMALLSLERRQIYRLLERVRQDGAAGLISRKRGRPSNRRYGDAFRDQVVSLVREQYNGFGPTLAREYLAERHGIRVSCETLRQMMMAAGLWKDRAARRPRPHQPRYRRDCRGELIQVDGSKHWWFEDRGPQCTLLVYIDDATSELMHLEMVESESTFAYMRATRTYIERHGKPVALYSDKHSAFRNNTASANGDGMTHLGRALHALNIEIICANSPQAKGRVERANGTLQDHRGGQCLSPRLHGPAQPAVRQDAVRPARSPPPAGAAREHRGRDGLARAAHGDRGADAALQQGAVHPGAEPGQPGTGAQAGRCLRVP